MTTTTPYRQLSPTDWEQAPPFGRHESLLHALRRLQEVHPGPSCIVETGTIRSDANRVSDGWSTMAWGWYCALTGGRAYTVDLNPAAIAVCQRITAPYAAHLEYVAADSVGFLRQWNAAERGEVHLLYLDSFDYDVDREQSERHCLAEAEAALPALAPVCLVLFDDTWPIGAAGEDGVPPLTGKGARAVPFLVGQGFRIEYTGGQQVLLSRGAGPLVDA